MAGISGESGGLIVLEATRKPPCVAAFSLPSPEQSYRISVEHPVGANEGHFLHLGLRDQQAVKRITMMGGQPKYRQGVLVRHGQRTQPLSCHAPWNKQVRRLRKVQLARRRLDCNFP